MRQSSDRKTAGDAVTDLIVEVFRLNGSLIEAGDALVRDIGLTSARWQVLGAVELAKSALPIARVARNMGLSRQAVRRLANEMANDGLLMFEDNPHHSRAKLVVMTAKGQETYRAAMALQKRWASALAGELAPQSINAAAAVLRKLRASLETP